VAALQGFRRLLDKTFKTNLAKNAMVKASTYRGKSAAFAPSKLTDGKEGTFWATDNGVRTGTIEITLNQKEAITYVLLQEYIPLGQRVKAFTVEAWQNNNWQQVAEGTTIGYKRILKITPVETTKLRITINDAKACPVLSNLELY
jgi:alpha-L-fucosidase